MLALQARYLFLNLGVIPVRMCELHAGLEAEGFHSAQRGHRLRVVSDCRLVELREVHANVRLIQARRTEERSVCAEHLHQESLHCRFFAADLARTGCLGGRLACSNLCCGDIRVLNVAEGRGGVTGVADYLARQIQGGLLVFLPPDLELLRLDASAVLE